MGCQSGIFQYFYDLLGPPTSQVSEGYAKTLIEISIFSILIFSHLFTKILGYLIEIR